MAVPIGFTPVIRITISPATVPSVMTTPSGAPTSRTRRWNGVGVPAYDTPAG